MDWQELEAFSFGDSPALADELAGLVLAGIKTATCWAAVDGLKTEPGKLTVMLGGNGQPLAIIETVQLALRRFDEVDASFAYDEGEDDRTLASWREAHRRYFTRLDQFSPDMMLSVSGSALWSGFDPDKQPGEPHNSMAASWSWLRKRCREQPLSLTRVFFAKLPGLSPQVAVAQLPDRGTRADRATPRCPPA